MLQYKEYIEGAYSYVPDTITGLRARWGQRSDKYVEDVELALGGFSLAENTGWVNLNEKYAPTVGSKYRLGVRSDAYVIDVETNGSFTGTENTDWENIQEIKPE